MDIDLGVVVGRFQIDQLHPGHRFLLDTVNEQCEKMLVVLGVGPLPTTCRKPLPFETRRAMILAIYPDAIVEALEDHPDDVIWSENLDGIIDALGYYSIWDTKPPSFIENDKTNKVKLFHGRDSFREVYSGQFNVVEIEQADLGLSATLHRQQIATTPELAPEFARGVIWANENKFPTVYGTVDMAAFDEYDKWVCLITKAGRDGLMFPGGFADPECWDDQEDAVRELREETGLYEVKELRYVGSTRVEDWRYAGEEDCLRTRMFTCKIPDSSADITAGDDAETAEWYQWAILTEESFNPCHVPLFKMLKEYRNDT